MSPSLTEIDAIVREVLRRLAPLALGSGVPVASPAAAAPAAVAVAAAACEELALGERLITLSVLKERLGNTRRLRLVPGAVVTPAARDELKSRGVTVERSTKAAGSGNTSAKVASQVIIARGADAGRLLAAVAAAGGQGKQVELASLSLATLHHVISELEQTKTPIPAGRQ